MLSYFCMSKKASFNLKRKELIVIAFLLIVVSAMALFLGFYGFLYGKVFPNTYVNTIEVGGLRPQETLDKLKTEVSFPPEITINIESNTQSNKFIIPSSAIDASADYDETVSRAYSVGRTGSKKKDIKTLLNSLLAPNQISLAIKVNEEKLDEQIAVISSQVPNPPVEPSLTIEGGEVLLVDGAKGNYVDTEKLKETIVSNLQNANGNIFYYPEQVDPTLSLDEKADYILRAENLLEKSLSLVAEDQRFTYKGQALLDYLSQKGGYRFDKHKPSFVEVKEAVSRPPQNPVFKYENNKVQEFSPAKDGLEVDVAVLESRVAEALLELSETDVDAVEIEIPLQRTPPDFATSDVNDLGIKELIGVGISSYRGSIPSRVYNVAHAASKLNGVLIKPGETFSFVNTLGDISALTGYKQAYVIQGNQTVLGDGGGVCQVSTTFFRAALNAGLPIVERHPHSYRVSYYEQGSDPGIDATIYHPTVDIKIKNDTPGHILIQTIADTKNMTLRFEFYGTSDGRVATVGKPVVSSVTPPPEDLYIDDPALPAGQIQQIDYKAWGARVYFDYKVERNGEILFEKTFNSNYRPWQAKFLRGTGPAV